MPARPPNLDFLRSIYSLVSVEGSGESQISVTLQLDRSHPLLMSICPMFTIPFYYFAAMSFFYWSANMTATESLAEFMGFVDSKSSTGNVGPPGSTPTATAAKPKLPHVVLSSRASSLAAPFSSWPDKVVTTVMPSPSDDDVGFFLATSAYLGGRLISKHLGRSVLITPKPSPPATSAPSSSLQASLPSMCASGFCSASRPLGASSPACPCSEGARCPGSLIFLPATDLGRGFDPTSSLLLDVERCEFARATLCQLRGVPPRPLTSNKAVRVAPLYSHPLHQPATPSDVLLAIPAIVGKHRSTTHNRWFTGPTDHVAAHSAGELLEQMLHTTRCVQLMQQLWALPGPAAGSELQSGRAPPVPYAFLAPPYFIHEDDVFLHRGISFDVPLLVRLLTCKRAASENGMICILCSSSNVLADIKTNVAAPRDRSSPAQASDSPIPSRVPCVCGGAGHRSAVEITADLVQHGRVAVTFVAIVASVYAHNVVDAGRVFDALFPVAPSSLQASKL